MRRDLALRGAGLGLVCAMVAGTIGFVEDNGGPWWGLWTALGLGTAGAVAGYFAFLRPARALRTVTDAAGRIGEGQLAQRVPDANGPAGDLTRAFNVMAGRIEQLFDSVAAEHARIEAVFDASGDAMVALAADTSVRFLNPAAVEVFGASMPESLGRPFIESARDYELDALVRTAIASGGAQTAVVTFGPRRIPLRAAALPIRDGGDWAILLLLTDLTEVQRLDAVRRDFVSNVSHELRTPLAAIRALVETMQEGVDAEESPEFLGRIHQQVERLTSLVNELLDLSRIESGAILLKPEPVDVSGLVSEAASLLRTKSEERGLTVAFEGEPLTVEADRASVLRVVTNLLDNAAKWSPQGGTIRVATKDEGDLVAICVQDEGPGIQELDLPRVFERFYKGEASRASSGVGLGLAIVKHLVRSHAGTATAESPPGEGAKFTVRLPKEFMGRRAGS